MTSALGLSVALIGGAHANPLDGKVVAGSATISTPNPATVQIDQASQNAVINWQSFNIEQGETTRFVQPNANAWTLNRVTGDMEPSRILGTLEANGNVAIINPDGILFGEGSRVDVNGLIATTHDISNDDFMAGRFNFTQSGNPGASVVNEGEISIGDYGLGAFVAPGVRNSGVITAKMGSISLASGNAFTLDLYGDDLIHLVVGDEIVGEVIDVATGAPVADLVKNEGRISADGGTVALKAATARRAVNSVINNTGVIEANSAGVRNGKIILGAQTAGTKTASAPVQRVRVSGTLSATNIPIPTWRPDIEGTGGNIEITGEMIEVAGAAIDASGAGGGGTILIGGDYLGGNASDEVMAEYGIQREASTIPTASYVSLDAGTTINADATVEGNGGKVVVWSDEATVTAAKITARGGSLAGDGGFIETSGKTLKVRASADASAAHGNAGTWLLDPKDLSIGDFGPGDTISSETIEASLNAGSNVSLRADNIYALLVTINKTSGGNSTLSILADFVQIGYAHISSSRAKLNVLVIADFLDFVNSSLDTNGGYVLANAQTNLQGSRIDTSGGSMTVRDTLPIASHFGSFDGIQVVDTDIVTGGGDLSLESKNSNIWFSNSDIDTRRGSIAATAGTRITADDSRLRTAGGDVSLRSRGTRLSGGHSTLSYLDLFGTNIETNGGDVDLRSNTDVYLTGLNGGHGGVNAGGGNVDVEAKNAIILGATTAPIRGHDVSLEAGHFISGSLSSRFTKPDVVVSGNLDVESFGFGFSARGTANSTFSGTWIDSAASRSIYGIMTLDGFGKTVLKNALVNGQVDARIEYTNGNFIGTVVRGDGFHFKETGFKRLEERTGIVNTKGISTSSDVRLDFGNKGLFFEDKPFETDGVINLVNVGAANGKRPDPTTFPKVGSGQIFLNGVLVGLPPIPQVIFNPGISVQDIIDRYADPDAPQCMLEALQCVATDVTFESNLTGSPVTGIVAPLAGTPNQAGRSFSKLVPMKESDGTQNITWGYDTTRPVGTRIVPTAGKTHFEPIDEMKLVIGGEEKTLSAYANIRDDGTKDALDGPFQCTALIADYLSVMGFKNAPRAIPNGKNVASTLGTGKNAEYFQYSSTGAIAPTVGTIVSMDAGAGGVADNVGHVAIVKGVEPVGTDKIVVTLIEQNATVNGEAGFAVNRKITFTRDSNGKWSAEHKFGSYSYNVLNWVTPVRLP
ncbi:hypothetical protein MAXJ12_11777 [Mesorhizobium alhagi CCNWXJ12-2]|uniref:Peptidase C51 domain-containing protein n=1 Tax=Mesorhizobium alhagi CCNWXJ12-2 TaxID=1107882 RepID=H0HQC5_9HYPH|nr:hypothetical protein MAXJ12_11777 [Mesorhizobium alhagi CCNWXJ12-2]